MWFPGRNGCQMYQRFKILLQKIRDPWDLDVKDHPNDPTLHQYFIKDVEKNITEELLSQVSKRK